MALSRAKPVQRNLSSQVYKAQQGMHFRSFHLIVRKSVTEAKFITCWIGYC